MNNRLAMDQRHLEHAHLQYAILVVCSWYHLNPITISEGKVDEDISEFAYLYHGAFLEKYASRLYMTCTYD